MRIPSIQVELGEDVAAEEEEDPDYDDVPSADEEVGSDGRPGSSIGGRGRKRSPSSSGACASVGSYGAAAGLGGNFGAGRKLSAASSYTGSVGGGARKLSIGASSYGSVGGSSSTSAQMQQRGQQQQQQQQQVPVIQVTGDDRGGKPPPASGRKYRKYGMNTTAGDGSGRYGGIVHVFYGS